MTELLCKLLCVASVHRRSTDGDLSEKEREQGELEIRSSNASKNLQAAQTSLSSLKSQVKAKQDEIKGRRFTSFSTVKAIEHQDKALTRKYKSVSGRASTMVPLMKPLTAQPKRSEFATSG